MIPAAPSKEVGRNNIDRAIANWFHGTMLLEVFSSGVRIIPPDVHNETKNAPMAARSIASIFAFHRRSALSMRSTCAYSPIATSVA